MYSFTLENIVPLGGLACLIAKATVNESNKWHRRLGYVNFKNLNKLMKGNLVRGLPSKIFQNDHTCVACQKGKQHKASCNAKVVSSISQPLQLLHMDLFGPTSVRSINHKTYFLVITDDFSRFSWVFFLRTKDETSGILKDFIRQIENKLNQKVKTFRCDNGTKFKNMDIIELCGSKWIKREYSNARTLQKNGVAKRKNMTLIEAARTMLADSFYLTLFGLKQLILLVMSLIGCHVTILNTIDHLGKFEGKSDEGFLVGYSLNNKAFRPMRSENQANKTASPEKANHSAGIQDNIDAGNFEMDADPAQDYFVLPIYSSYTSTDKSSEVKNKAEVLLQAGAARATSTNTVNTVSTPLSTANPSNVFNIGGPSYPNLTYYAAQYDSQIPALEDIYVNSNDGIFTNAYYDDEGAVADFTNLESTVNVSPIPTSRIHSIHPTTQILGYPKSVVQTRSKVYKNKQDERGVVVRNKARLVAQGHRQEEGIDCDEVFAFARIEAIRIFLAFASYMGFVVNQMDAKSTFLYDTIDEEVYVSQPLGFVDPKFPKKFYKSGYIIGTIDKTLFIKKDKNDIMLSISDDSMGRITSSFLLTRSNRRSDDPLLVYNVLDDLPDITRLQSRCLFRFQVQLILLSTCGLELSLDEKRKLLKAWISFSVGFNTTQQMVINAPCLTDLKNWLSPEQTASALAIPGQTTTGKESSNPLMADSLPKTIQSNDPPLLRGYTLRSGEDSLKPMTW
ncbi:putative ribonuclease H-like domain-containing protein [Tanacetum coccineum]|uniref:Ribonuclease H-like domain-containing protein n=1 Tax=Tanacetum coccineum TaxID=301880 RepID=A0ABQ5ETY2_9ASTR